ncbi:MAG: hypothetical protein KF740_05985 [Ramlibacter sp.]|jgi:hypothetical protein|nr:hypothetical protein [Ramlibacter sp.]
MDENAFYETEARELIKRIRREKDVPYWRLAENLSALGVEMEEQALINRVNRGRYSFAFALQLLAALGVETLEVPRPPRAGHRPKAR